ncbi:hypothetical protein SERLADRAFT_431923 [Serpula lacrymans var. lacrymans S7.9]|uniref:Uncharacterized protein n=1 Tax=Serpula lacrymans var. lacrymans (strain S7.9) TaxID=578457 RepID=F8NE59_SERL9|nr:uncharacterized protein SERLADRAFT_431923 [Serpula lacrymans var. lacrymans S7.9]EGO30388.1 hypothetical protein SERLADRAFT_431923 [Serpula lacrymans var. lacrymans S7.9]
MTSSTVFNDKLIHKPGTLMGKADTLSRREDHANGIEDDNKGITLIDQSRVANVRIWQDSDLLEVFKKDISSEEKAHLDGNENYLWEDGLFHFKDNLCA